MDNELSNSSEQEVFAEVELFGASYAAASSGADCNCHSCDGNPCNK